MKYVDVEKPIAEIERRYHKAVDESKYMNSAKFVRNELENLREFSHFLLQEQSSLSSNLDEAAEKYYFSPACSWEDHEERFINAFKAGAKWAMQQLKVK